MGSPEEITVIDTEAKYYEDIISKRQSPPWQHGTPIKFSRLQEIEEYENDVIRPCTDMGPIDSEGSGDYWQHWPGRKRLSEIIAIKQFYGRYVDIELLPIDSEHSGFEYAKNHVFTVGGNKNFMQRLEDHPNSFNSFIVTAGMHSTRKRDTGILEVGLFYAPVPPGNIEKSKNSGTKIRRSSSGHPAGLSRFITRPERYKLLDMTVQGIKEESIEQALQITRYALKKPYQGGSFENSR